MQNFNVKSLDLRGEKEGKSMRKYVAKIVWQKEDLLGALVYSGSKASFYSYHHSTSIYIPGEPLSYKYIRLFAGLAGFTDGAPVCDTLINRRGRAFLVYSRLTPSLSNYFTYMTLATVVGDARE